MKQMVKMKKWLCLALVLCMVLQYVPVTAHAKVQITSGTTGDCTWNMDLGSGTLTISGNGPMPDYEYSYEEENFGSQAPWYQEGYSESIKAIIVEDGVTHIGSYAFAHSINAKTATIADSVTSIGDFAFITCEALETVTLSNNLVSIGEVAFHGAAALSEITFPDTLKTIGSQAFYDCPLTALTLPEGLEKVESNAFVATQLTSIEIPASMTHIGHFAFETVVSAKIGLTEEQWNAGVASGEISDTVFASDAVLTFIYNVTIDNSQAGGSVAADKTKCEAGETVTLTPTPNEGYLFESWNVTDTNSNPVSVDENNQFVMPASSVTVQATFDLCGHTWEEGLCTACGSRCSHNYTYGNFQCTVCGKWQEFSVNSSNPDLVGIASVNGVAVVEGQPVTAKGGQDLTLVLDNLVSEKLDSIEFDRLIIGTADIDLDDITVDNSTATVFIPGARVKSDITFCATPAVSVTYELNGGQFTEPSENWESKPVYYNYEYYYRSDWVEKEGYVVTDVLCNGESCFNQKVTFKQDSVITVQWECAHSHGTNPITDNYNGTHSFTCTACEETVTQDHDFQADSPCECGARAVAAIRKIYPYAVYNDYYHSFEAALEAWVDNSTLVLLTDITLDESLAINGSGKLLDLNGYTLDTDLEFSQPLIRFESGTLIITSSREGGTINSRENPSILVCGSLGIFENVTITGADSGTGVAGTLIVDGENAELVLKSGGTVISTSENPAIYVNKGSFTMTGGTAKNTDVGNAIITQNGNISLQGGTVSAAYDDAVYLTHASSATVAGTEISAPNYYHFEIFAPNTDTVLDLTGATGHEYTIELGYNTSLLVANLKYDPDKLALTSSKPTGNAYTSSPITLSCSHKGSQHTDGTDNGDGTHSFVCTVCDQTVNEHHNFQADYTCFCSATAAAAVDGTGYGTFDTAVAAWGDNSTLVLLTDVTLTNQLNLSGTDKVLDLNGHTLGTKQNSGKCYLSLSSGNLTIQSSQVRGIIDTNINYRGISVTGGTLTIGENVTLTGAPDGSGLVGTLVLRDANANAVLAGGTIISTSSNSAVYSYNGASFTLTDGTVKKTNAGIAITAQNGTISLQGGSVSSDGRAAVYLKSASGATVTRTEIITEGNHFEIYDSDGKAKLDLTGATGPRYTIKLGSDITLPVENLTYDADKLALTSDSSKPADGVYPADETIILSCTHKGSQHTTGTDNGDGTHSFVCTVCDQTVNEHHNFQADYTCFCDATAAAAVDGTGYETFEAALKAWGDDSTLVLLTDATLRNRLVLFDTDKVLDLNGHTLGMALEYKNDCISLSGGNLTIKSSQAGGRIDVAGINEYSTIIVYRGKLTIGENVTLTGANSVFGVGGTLVVDGENAKAELAGGTVISISRNPAIYVYEGSFTMTGGAVENTNIGNAIITQNGNISLQGGTVSAANDDAVYLMYASGATVAGTEISTPNYHFEIFATDGDTELDLTGATGHEYSIKLGYDTYLPVENLTYDADKLALTSDSSKPADGVYPANQTIILSCPHKGSQHTTGTDKGDGTHDYKCTVCDQTINERHSFRADYTCFCGATKAAAVDGTGYDTFEAALAAWGNKSTLVLLTDVTLTTPLDLSGTDKVLDLNGHTLTIQSSSNVCLLSLSSGNLTIQSSQEGGRIDTGTSGKGIHVTGGTLTIGENVTLTGASRASGVAGTLVLDGANAKAELAGGTIISTYTQPAVYSHNGASFTLTDGTVENTHVGYAITAQNGNISLQGGTVSAAKANAVYLKSASDATVTGTEIITKRNHFEIYAAKADTVLDLTGATGLKYSIKLGSNTALPVASLKYDPDKLELTSGKPTGDAYPTAGTIILSCSHKGSQHTTGTDKGDGTHSSVCTICGKTFTQAHDFNNDHICTICNYVCAHENFTDGMCEMCGMITHTLDVIHDDYGVVIVSVNGNEVTQGETILVEHGKPLTVVLDNIASTELNDILLFGIELGIDQIPYTRDGNTLTVGAGVVTGDIKINAKAMLHITVDMAGGEMTQFGSQFFTIDAETGRAILGDEMNTVHTHVYLPDAFSRKGYTLSKLVHEDGSDYAGINEIFRTDLHLTIVWECDHSLNTNETRTCLGIRCSECGNYFGEKDPDHHANGWVYSAEGSTVTVSCADHCGATGTATISAESKTYDGTAVIPTVTKTGSLENTDISISLTKDGEAFTGQPIDTGTYTASISLEGKTASVEFTVAKAKLTVTAKNHTVTYGDIPANAGVVFEGFVNNETEAVLSGELTYVCNYEQFGNVGIYAITPGGLTSGNYEITFVPGKLTVAPKAITVIAKSAEKTYGDTDPKLTYEVEGLVGDDQMSGKLTRSEGENVGTYAIALGTLTAGDNYNVSYTGADFTVGKRDVTVTPEDQTIFYGSAISADAFTGSGLVDGHVLTVTLKPSTANVTADGSIAASAAVITSGNDDVTGNYQIRYEDGKLVIQPDTAGIDGLTTENVTSANAEDIQAVQNMMDSAESLQTQWESIEETCKALSGKIAAVAAEIARIQDAVSGYDENTVNTSAEADLTQLAGDLDALLDSDNLTDKERAAQESLKDKCEDLLTKISDTKDLMDQVKKTMEGMKTETVNSGHTDALEQAIAAIDKLLKENHLTEAQRKEMTEAKAEAEALLDTVDTALNDTKTENIQKVERITSENVKLEDQTALEQALSELEQALKQNSGNYTQKETEDIQAEINRLKDAIQTVEQVKTVNGLIAALPDTPEQKDEAAVLQAQEAFDSLSDYEKTLVDEANRSKLEELRDAIRECDGSAQCPGHGYKDLNASAWYHKYTDYALRKGYMQGYSATTFAPNDSLSRAMTVQILYNLEGRPAVSGSDAFTDTKPGAWYTDAILWATQNSLVQGYGNGKFGPNDPITREQIATIFYRYSKEQGYDLTQGSCSSFPDADAVSNYAQTAMNWAVGQGLIIGMNDGKLHPQRNTTRAEVATIVYRFLEQYLA